LLYLLIIGVADFIARNIGSLNLNFLRFNRCWFQIRSQWCSVNLLVLKRNINSYHLQFKRSLQRDLFLVCSIGCTYGTTLFYIDIIRMAIG
jgi:hypothetical protein